MTHCAHPRLRHESAQWGIEVLLCPDCGAVMPAKPTPAHEVRQRKLPGMGPGVQSNAVPVSEDQVQSEIVKALRMEGCIVLVTSHRRAGVACPSCKQWFRPNGGTGCTKGIPDLLVRRPEWPSYLWLGLEVKGPKTTVSPEQKQLAEGGHIYIVRSVSEARKAVNREFNPTKGQNANE